MGSILSASRRVLESLDHCAFRRAKPQAISFFEIVMNAWDVDDIYRIDNIRQRYPQIIGMKVACRVCNKTCRLDTDFAGHQVRNLCNPRPYKSGKPRIPKGLLCICCRKKLSKETAKRKRLTKVTRYPQLRGLDATYQESAFIQDPMMRAIYDANRDLKTDLNHYGIYSTEDM